MKFINSVGKRFTLLPYKNDLNNIIKSITKKEFEIIKQKYINSSPAPGYSKYLDLNTWVKKRMYDFIDLDLKKSTNLNILDIGTGAGYFPYICNYYGHKSHAIDLDSVQMYNEITKLLNIERTTWEIKAYEKLPNFASKFDFVTAFMICFNSHTDPNVWRIKEWDFFLNDLANNHMSDNGKIYFLFNPETDGKFYSADLKKFFIDMGATIVGPKVYFSSIKKIKSN